MITIEKTFPGTIAYPLERLGDPEKLVFFDIETTGFSADYNTVYLIGCIWPEGDHLRLIQWFADTRDAEADVLAAFFDFLNAFDTLVHFNGDMFDIPFVTKRAKALKLSPAFDRVESVDIFRRIKSFKKLLSLPDMKQKTIEHFLKISREDLYTGGELIEVYLNYLNTRNEEEKCLLLLHNEDDLKGMPALLPILFYPDFFAQNFTLNAVREASGETDRLILSLSGDPQTILPSPVSASVPTYAFRADKDRMELSIRVYSGTLKFYYPNYKDYYYLIYEDTAIHKSVGEFVDKDARIKATKETCYTKKDGLFLPQPTDIWDPEFKTSCKDKTGFFEIRKDCFSDPEKLNRYIKEIISFLK